MITVNILIIIKIINYLFDINTKMKMNYGFMQIFQNIL